MFPPLVTGIVVLMIGVSLLKVGFHVRWWRWMVDEQQA